MQSTLADGTDARALMKHERKRKEIAEAYKLEGVEINPLLLIQLPDRKTQQEDLLKRRSLAYLRIKTESRLTKVSLIY